jgi:flagellar biosynthesis protein FlhA
MITGFLIKSTTEPQLESIGGSAEIPTAQTPSGPILTTPQEVSEILQTDTVEVEIGYGLIPLADTSQGGDLLERVTMVRKQIAYELGLVISPIRVRDSVLLKSNEYAIFIRGAQVAKYELMPNRLLAINPGTVTEKIPGIETKEPAFGLQAFWIDESKKEEASRLGYTVVDPPTVFATHLTEVLKRNAHELLGTREFELLVEGLRSKFEKLVDDLFNVLKPSDVKKVLQRLLKEGIPIRNLSLIFETLLEYGEQTKDVIYLTEKVRKAMKRQIITPLISPDGILHAVAIDNELEKNLVNLVRENDTERYLDLNPEIMRELIESISNSLENIMKKGYNPVLICSSSLRPLISDLLLKFIPGVYVISYDEIPENVSMQIEGVVRL